MKNRKAPVMLFGVAVVAIGGMTVFNASQKPVNPEADQQATEEKVGQRQMTEEDRQKAKDALLQHLPDKNGKAATSPGRKMPMSPVDAPGSSMEMAKEPTILIKKYVSSPPKPNDSGTSTHWYDDESRSAKIAEENSRTKG